MLFIVIAGYFSYSAVISDLNRENLLMINLFKTVLHQNSLQLVSNPEDFERVVVSDMEGQVLIQYGNLIPGLDVLNGNPIFGKIVSDDYSISNFYFDPVIKKVCFDIGLKSKNRVYIGTITLDESINKFLRNADLCEFIVLDDNDYGYLLKENNFIAVNKNNGQKIKWLNASLFRIDNTVYYYSETTVDLLHFISFSPVLNKILPLFLLFLLPFFIGFLIINLVKRMLFSDFSSRSEEISAVSQMIESGEKIPEDLYGINRDVNQLIYSEVNQLIEKADVYKKEILRYSEKLGDFSEYHKNLKLNLEYIQRYFEELQLKETIQLEEAVIDIFRMFFAENNSTIFAVIAVNDEEIFSCGEKTEKTFELIEKIVELGPYKVQIKIVFEEKKNYDFRQLELLLFDIFVKYLLYLYFIKSNEYTNELNSTRNFQLFTELVSKEIHKVYRYNLKGVLACFVINNREDIIGRYGPDIFQMINDSVSAVLKSEIRKSDILGTYKEGFYLVYFYDFEYEKVKEKIRQIGEKISIEEKIKQLGVHIDLKTDFSVIEKNIRNFEAAFGKLLIKEDNED
ncbi:MAG TPA: hypothetical protein PK466_00605 [Thermotogota bacterium]|nr:hypothetical protein [Thermotogota bacterium]HPJ87594.1 hypothetical protein [Thermotogota bacterium]HPR94799.1 hypothetical protein [Thermotogota bacterium]